LYLGLRNIGALPPASRIIRGARAGFLLSGNFRLSGVFLLSGSFRLAKNFEVLFFRRHQEV
jgi:hypothetical protein